MHVHPAISAVRHWKWALVPFSVPRAEGSDWVPDPVNRVSDPGNRSNCGLRAAPAWRSRTNTDRHGNALASRRSSPTGRPAADARRVNKPRTQIALAHERLTFAVSCPVARVSRGPVAGFLNRSCWLSSELNQTQVESGDPRHAAWPPDARSAYRLDYRPRPLRWLQCRGREVEGPPCP